MQPFFWPTHTHSRTPITVVRNHFLESLFFIDNVLFISLKFLFSPRFYSAMKYSSSVIHSCEKEAGKKIWKKRKIQRKLMKMHYSRNKRKMWKCGWQGYIFNASLPSQRAIVPASNKRFLVCTYLRMCYV